MDLIESEGVHTTFDGNLIKDLLSYEQGCKDGLKTCAAVHSIFSFKLKQDVETRINQISATLDLLKLGEKDGVKLSTNYRSDCFKKINTLLSGIRELCSADPLSEKK